MVTLARTVATSSRAMARRAASTSDPAWFDVFRSKIRQDERKWACRVGSVPSGLANLEHDFATQAKSLSDLRSGLERLIAGHIAISLKHGLKPFRNVRRAPDKYWELFRRPKISLPVQTFGFRIKKRGIKIPTPEIRVS